MKTLLVALMVMVALAGATVAFAQQAAAPFTVIEEVHVTPGMDSEFEAVARARTLRMATGNLSFAQYAGASENGFYRFFTQLSDDFSSVDRWRKEIAGMPPAAGPVSGVDIIQHIDRSVWQSRPDLSHVPESPRLENSEFGFSRTVRLFVKFGAEAEASSLLRQIAALEEGANVRDPRFVSSRVLGPESPTFELQFFARDASDYYRQTARKVATLGEAFQDLVNQVNRLCRRVEVQNYIPMPELTYQPTN